MSAAVLVLAGLLAGFLFGAVAMAAHHWRRNEAVDQLTAKAMLRSRYEARLPLVPRAPSVPTLPPIDVPLDCTTCEWSNQPVTPESPCKTCFFVVRATKHTPKKHKEKNECC